MTRAIATLAAALLLPGSGALGAAPPKRLAPPGNSGVTEYMEDVPSDMGTKPPVTGGAPSPALGTAERRQLESDGSEGKLLVAVDDATGPATVQHQRLTPAPSGPSDQGHQGEGPGVSALSGAATPAGSDAFSRGGSADRGGSSVSAVLSAAVGLGGGGAIGVLAPVLMGLGLLGAVVAVLRRRSGRS